MYEFSYAEIQSDSVADSRDREKQVLTRSIELLTSAKEAGVRSMETIEALRFVNRVWTTFVEDLGDPENSLPKELRANLISIGLWVLREAEEVRQERSEDFDGIIEITAIIRDGIQ